MKEIRLLRFDKITCNNEKTSLKYSVQFIGINNSIVVSLLSCLVRVSFTIQWGKKFHFCLTKAAYLVMFFRLIGYLSSKALHIERKKGYHTSIQ